MILLHGMMSTTDSGMFGPMMDMMGGSSSGMWAVGFFGWLAFLLFLAIEVLAIAWLWKQIKK